jgi:Tol biopolymer transport system component
MLAPGTRLGVYEIRGPLGAGGMGEVYRALDTRLGRDVALKILPGDLTGDAGRIARFEQEARTVAGLNHPNIVAVHDIGRHDGVAYIVSELVDGVTLRGLTRSTREVVHIAAQIADGLAAAHAAGVTHRDLKPDNVMLTHDGRVKILDFGVAKVSGPLTPDAKTATHTSPGVIVGTMGYMAPEQVRAGAVDHRADIFAFGALLYELVSGARAFTGDTGAEVMTAVLKDEPRELPPDVPSGIRQIVQRCLEKRPEGRFQSAHDLAFALRHLSGTSSTAAAPAAAPGRRRRVLAWAAGAGFAAGAVVAGLLALRWAAADDAAIEPVRLTRISADRQSETAPAFSPDGRSLAYLRAGGDGVHLLVRSLDAVSPVVLARGVPSIGRVGWSADGNRVCYQAPGRTLMCVSAAGGVPQRLLTEASSAQFTRDGSAVYLIRAADGAPWLFRSAPPGAEPERVGREPLPDAVVLSPVSPDGSRAILLGAPGRWTVSLADGTRRLLATDAGVRTRAVAWLGDTGHIVAAEEMPGSVGFRVILQDTTSSARRLIVRLADPITSLSASPDGRRLVYSSGPVDRDVVEYSADGTFVRGIATSAALEGYPSWSSSGDRFVYQAGGPGQPDSLWMATADGAGASMIQKLAVSGAGTWTQMSPDGGRVAYADPTGIHVVSTSGGSAIRVLAAERIGQGLCWSPDGEWIWYSEGPLRLAKVPSQGGTPVPIPAGPGLLIGCSPDGRWLVRRGTAGYLLTSPDGKTERQLASYDEHAPAANSPQFGRDGRVVYLLGSDRRSVLVRDVETGRVLRSITFSIPEEDLIMEFAVHPAGARVLLSTGGDRYDLWMAEGFAQPAARWRRWFGHWETPSPAAGQ